MLVTAGILYRLNVASFPLITVEAIIPPPRTHQQATRPAYSHGEGLVNGLVVEVARFELACRGVVI